MDEIRKKSARRTLHVLLVISYIVTGYYLLSYLLMGLTLPYMHEQMEAIVSKFPEEFAIMIDKVLAIPSWYFLVSALLNVVSVVGLTKMWKVQKSGFHWYTLSKLLLMLMPVLFLDRSYVAIGDMMLAILFIIYYFILLKMLNDSNSTDAVTADESSSSEIESQNNDEHSAKSDENSVG